MGLEEWLWWEYVRTLPPKWRAVLWELCRADRAMQPSELAARTFAPAVLVSGVLARLRRRAIVSVAPRGRARFYEVTHPRWLLARAGRRSV